MNHKYEDQQIVCFEGLEGFYGVSENRVCIVLLISAAPRVYIIYIVYIYVYSNPPPKS